jgi:hypothetical protein
VTAVELTATDERRIDRLRVFNALMAVLHFTQGVAILLLASDFKLPVETAFLRFDETADRLVTDRDVLLDLPLAPLIAAFVFISAAAHALVTLPGVFEWYKRNLGRSINYVRWWEYAFSASVMIVVIAMLVGVYDIGALIALFAINACMIFCGLLMEVFNKPGQRVNWTPFWLGCFAGAIPWVVITLFLVAPASRSVGDVPTFVYAIYISLFLFFNVFALNMWLQYKQVGPWRDYLFGETAYIVLSLTSKSALAWQTFFGTLRDV